MTAYYNEFKPEAAHMLRQLIKDGLIAAGDVDERSITEVKADDIKNYTQCHFFAGIGGWSVALRLAGWGDDTPVWTGSCPCQPFSSAGRQKGKADERHLWPAWFSLIRELRPATVFGEQVESAIAHGWLDDVYNDMEGEGYAVGSAVLPACAVGKPHQRKRLWFVGHSESWTGRNERENERQGCNEIDASTNAGRTGNGGRMLGDGACENGTLGNTQYDGQSSRQVAGSEGQAVFNHTQGTDCAGQFEGAGQSCEVADTDQPRSQGQELLPECGSERRAGADGVEWLQCPDGKSRPVKSGLRLLAHGVQHRAPILHAFGNAIVPQVAAEFINAYQECRAYNDIGEYFMTRSLIESEKPSKYLRPSLREIQMGAIYRYVPSQGKKMLFSPIEILAMHDYALTEILDLSEEGVRNIQAEARWLERHNRKVGRNDCR